MDSRYFRNFGKRINLAAPNDATKFYAFNFFGYTELETFAANNLTLGLNGQANNIINDKKLVSDRLSLLLQLKAAGINQFGIVYSAGAAVIINPRSVSITDAKRLTADRTALNISISQATFVGIYQLLANSLPLALATSQTTITNSLNMPASGVALNLQLHDAIIIGVEALLIADSLAIGLACNATEINNRLLVLADRLPLDVTAEPVRFLDFSFFAAQGQNLTIGGGDVGIIGQYITASNGQQITLAAGNLLIYSYAGEYEVVLASSRITTLATGRSNYYTSLTLNTRIQYTVTKHSKI